MTATRTILFIRRDGFNLANASGSVSLQLEPAGRFMPIRSRAGENRRSFPKYRLSISAPLYVITFPLPPRSARSTCRMNRLQLVGAAIRRIPGAALCSATKIYITAAYI